MGGNLKDGQAFGRGHDDAGALDVLVGASAILPERAKPCLLSLGEDNADSLSHASDSHFSRTI